LLDAFTDYNGVIKSWNPAVNAPERVEVSKKTTLTPSTKNKGRTETTRKDIASEKATDKGEIKSF
jgi:hypothetical protein